MFSRKQGFARKNLEKRNYMLKKHGNTYIKLLFGAGGVIPKNVFKKLNPNASHMQCVCHGAAAKLCQVIWGSHTF